MCWYNWGASRMQIQCKARITAALFLVVRRFSRTHLNLMSTDAIKCMELTKQGSKWWLFADLNMWICRTSQNSLCQSRALWTTISPIAQEGVVQSQLRWVLLNNFANDDVVQISTQCHAIDHCFEFWSRDWTNARGEEKWKTNLNNGNKVTTWFHFVA